VTAKRSQKYSPKVQHSTKRGLSQQCTPVASWQGGGGATTRPVLACRKIYSCQKIFLDRKGIFTLKFRKPGWSKNGKVVSESILKCNFFMQTYVLSEKISHYFSTHAIGEFKVKVLDSFYFSFLCLLENYSFLSPNIF